MTLLDEIRELKRSTPVVIAKRSHALSAILAEAARRSHEDSALLRLCAVEEKQLDLQSAALSAVLAIILDEGTSAPTVPIGHFYFERVRSACEIAGVDIRFVQDLAQRVLALLSALKTTLREPISNLGE